MKLHQARAFATMHTKVCIVGCGPVGMSLSAMLNKYRIPNVIIEKHASLQGMRDLVTLYRAS